MDWARDNESTIDRIIDDLVDDCLGYLRLVGYWPKYVQAIKDLDRYMAYMLFKLVENDECNYSNTENVPTNSSTPSDSTRKR